MEAAVIDAHDLSDPGIEAASMEAAVILAADLADEQMKKHDEHKKTFFNKMKSIFRTFSQKKLYNDLLEVKDAEAKYATDLSNAAAFEHVEEEELQEDKMRDEDGEKGEDLVYANSKKNDDETFRRALSVEEHYKSIDKDIKTIERLIKEADQADRSEVCSFLLYMTCFYL